ncbi:hypothetical protein, partial [Desulfurococcus sp.]|uniref:hypothetical protein n=1 Tax=Desulfurococcus sp. TaxID=51678 RepID=UPI003D0E5252
VDNHDVTTHLGHPAYIIPQYTSQRSLSCPVISVMIIENPFSVSFYTMPLSMPELVLVIIATLRIISHILG